MTSMAGNWGPEAPAQRFGDIKGHWWHSQLEIWVTRPPRPEFGDTKGHQVTSVTSKPGDLGTSRDIWDPPLQRLGDIRGHWGHPKPEIWVTREIWVTPAPRGLGASKDIQSDIHGWRFEDIKGHQVTSMAGDLGASKDITDPPARTLGDTEGPWGPPLWGHGGGPKPPRLVLGDIWGHSGTRCWTLGGIWESSAGHLGTSGDTWGPSAGHLGASQTSLGTLGTLWGGPRCP